jgi:hypothetical protein
MDRRNVGGAGGRGAEIAGPRRVRRRIAAPPAEVDTAAELPTLQNVRALPALDYDEPTAKVVVLDRRAMSAALEETRPGRVQRVHGLRLFVVGVALGAMAVSFVTGDALHLVRAWSASAIRSIEHRPPPPVEAPVVATIAMPKPCVLTDEDCAALMAPYLAADPPVATAPAMPDVPLVDVTELPMVQEPPPPRPARALRAAAAPRQAKASDGMPSSDEDDVLPLDAPPAVLPHPEDVLDPPATKPVPAKPPPLFDAPGGDQGGPVAAASPIKT